MCNDNTNQSVQNTDLEVDDILNHVVEARRLLQQVRDESRIPAIARAAHQADLYCFSILWELGAENETTPELGERIKD